jgi:cyanate lyase
MTQGCLTSELLQELLVSDDAEGFVEAHEFTKLDLSSYLVQLLQEKGLRKSEVIHASDLNETFAYQIFSGSRRCKRDKALQLAFAMHLNLDETKHLLYYAEASPLYCKTRRDAIIIYCLVHGYTLLQAEEELYHLGEDTINDPGFD